MMTGTSEPERLIGVDSQANAADGVRVRSPARLNPEEFVRLYRRHYDTVFRYCAHRLFERQSAEDATAEVFLKVVENLAGFKGDEQRFRCWLYRIASNVANEHLRRGVRRRKLYENASRRAETGIVDCPADRAPAPDKLTLLKAAVRSLKPRYQTIITLRFFENMKLTEIAQVLDRSPGTVRSRLARALAKLRKVLDAGYTESLKVNQDEK
ncbi:MAG: sigma-70 family RNA polymerase sigma factor [Phycisphaerales bacterium]|nr:MAG: sigma-70 family RNA polymerase sigma factor [Phycisphaerales bacterium]